MNMGMLAMVTLFPAYAGVIPKLLSVLRYAIPFPRIRGGDPMQRSDLTVYEHFSPQTRG